MPPSATLEHDTVVGIAGTGRMGTAMASRLLVHGYRVLVWNRTPERTRPLAQQGAAVASSPVGLAARSNVVISALRDPEAIDDTYRSPAGLLADELGGTLFIEMSTMPPESERSLAREVVAQGGRMIDCPVAGSVGPAARGELIGFVGGEPVDLAEARPILEVLCRSIEHVGPVGAGAVVKLAIQLPLHLYWQVLGEALAICEPLGLPPERLLEIFVQTPGAPQGLADRTGSVVAALRGESSGEGAFDIDAVRKDLRLMLAELERTGSDGPLTRATLARYDAVSAKGLGTATAAAVTREAILAARHRRV